jgi:stress-induced morphogen
MLIRRSILLVIATTTMLTRAFTISNTARNILRQRSSSNAAAIAFSSKLPTASASTSTVRFMSTTDDETTIVQTCTDKIMKALETDDVKVTGAYDDPNGSHISIEVVSSKFEGKRAVQRQQLVYKALWDELQGPVHAVDAMICKTPEEK